MRRFSYLALALAAGFCWTDAAPAQDTPSAKGTRKILTKAIDVDQKEVGTKDFLDEISNELDFKVKFKIDNGSGVSNNTKMTYKGKGVTVEKMLNDLADKYDWGWFVISNAGDNKVDGKVQIRKSSKGKERGYEAGKEPKKTTSLEIDLAPATRGPMFAPRERAWNHPAYVSRSLGSREKTGPDSAV